MGIFQQLHLTESRLLDVGSAIEKKMTFAALEIK